MVIKWRMINGKNVQINVPDSKSIKEQMQENKHDADATKKHLLSNTDKNMTHQERVNYNSHPDRKKEADDHYERQRRLRDEHQKSLGFGAGSAGRVDMYLAQGDISENDAFQMAFEDNGYHYSKKKKRYVR